MAESSQKKIGRGGRSPRVQIEYEVETGEGTVKRELPFVVGVIGDFTADSRAPQKSLRERKFIKIDPDNLNKVMERLQPALSLKVDNALSGDGSQIGVQLTFSSMDDFQPARVAQQVPALKKLLEARARLRELQVRVDMSEELERLLQGAITDADATMVRQLGAGGAANTDKEGK